MGFNQAMQTVSLESLIFVLNLPYSAMIMWRVKHFHSLQSWLNQVLKSIEIWTQIITNLYEYQHLSKYFKPFNKNVVVIPTYSLTKKSLSLEDFFKYTEHVPSIMNSFPPSINLKSCILFLLRHLDFHIVHIKYKYYAYNICTATQWIHMHVSRIISEELSRHDWITLSKSFHVWNMLQSCKLWITWLGGRLTSWWRLSEILNKTTNLSYLPFSQKVVRQTDRRHGTAHVLCIAKNDW